MIVTHPNGETIELPFTPMNCTGYVAERIEITACDVRAMINLFERDRDTFLVSLRQLEFRFPQARLPA